MHKVFALKRHPVLNRDATTKQANPLYVAVRHGFAVVEEPSETVEGNVCVDAFEYIEEPVDRFIVGGMQPERPAIRHKQTDDRLQLLFKRIGQVRARLEEVFEVGGQIGRASW